MHKSVLSYKYHYSGCTLQNKQVKLKWCKIHYTSLIGKCTVQLLSYGMAEVIEVMYLWSWNAYCKPVIQTVVFGGTCIHN